MAVNLLIEQLNKLWADPATRNSNRALMSYGYGQTALPFVKKDQNTSEPPKELYDIVGNIAKHQGVYVDISDLGKALSHLEQNRMKVDPMELFCTSGGEFGKHIMQNWGHTTGCYGVLQFDNMNHLKHFFNAGSTIDVEFKVKRADDDQHGRIWQEIFNEVGRIKIGADHTSTTGKGSAWKEGAYTLTDQKTKLFAHGKDFNKLMIEGRRTDNSIWIYVTLTSNSTIPKTSRYTAMIDSSYSKGYVQVSPPERLK